MAAYAYFDIHHWQKVKAERSRLGLHRSTEVGAPVPHHSLVGQTLVDAETNRTYVVESVKKDWLQGWFLSALLSQNGSHRVCLVENISSVDNGILQGIFQFQDNFKPQH